MSVIVTARFKGDPAKLEEVANAQSDTLQRIAEDSRTKACLHHCFVEADGDILVVDEWESVEAFQSFFAANADIAGVMQEVGVAGAPEVKTWRKLDTPDTF